MAGHRRDTPNLRRPVRRATRAGNRQAAARKKFSIAADPLSRLKVALDYLLSVSALTAPGGVDVSDVLARAVSTVTDTATLLAADAETTRLRRLRNRVEDAAGDRERLDVARLYLRCVLAGKHDTATAKPRIESLTRDLLGAGDLIVDMHQRPSRHRKELAA